MNARWFDAFARSLAQSHPRRGLFSTWTAAELGALLGERTRAAAQDTETVGLPCAPRNCTNARCDCYIIGITGSGVLRTGTGDVNLVLFAIQLAFVPARRYGPAAW